MSKRAGTLVSLREVVDEVGRDATRFIFLTRRSDAPLDFDLDLAKKQTLDNPVFYVQYGHARLAAIFAQGARGRRGRCRASTSRRSGRSPRRRSRTSSGGSPASPTCSPGRRWRGSRTGSPSGCRRPSPPSTPGTRRGSGPASGSSGSDPVKTRGAALPVPGAQADARQRAGRPRRDGAGADGESGNFRYRRRRLESPHRPGARRAAAARSFHARRQPTQPQSASISRSTAAKSRRSSSGPSSSSRWSSSSA